MKRITVLSLLFCGLNGLAQNALYIPPTLTGTTFNLNVQSGSKVFYDTLVTPTFGINGVWMAPTILVNKGDSVTLNVTNNLSVRTTMHWHGLHVSAMNDGGPHQQIKPSTTWSPSFKVRNNAATFWYHPHGANQTEQQIGKGLAGFFIVKDAAEAALPLPRSYGVDDFPIMVQTKDFDELGQIAIATDMDTSIFVNGTLNAFLNAPAQVVRFRLLNASSLRSYYFGFSNGQTFYQIATDGGMKDSSLALTRLLLSPGERAEILVNFTGMAAQTIFLKSFASELPHGIYGADTVGFGVDTIHEYHDNFLNGADFNLLKINVVVQTGSPVTAIPAALIPYTPFNGGSATRYRTIVMDTIRLLPFDPPNRAEGSFGLNNKTFDIGSVNEVVHLNTTEIWTLVNKTLVAHPFHIHDIQFNVVEKSGRLPKPSERGWKDVILVLPGDSVKFITKFETFADPETPYMYHCHLLHHEDDGMMGSFLVIDSTATQIEELESAPDFLVYPNPASTQTVMQTNSPLHHASIQVMDLNGQVVNSKDDISGQVISISCEGLSKGMYFVRVTEEGRLIATKKLVVIDFH